jgi:F-type H+-transporting ATPase subunit b
MNINLTMIGQLMMFAMFTWFCMKFVWPPIVAAMEERKKRIESGLIAAERGLSEHKEELH